MDKYTEHMTSPLDGAVRHGAEQKQVMHISKQTRQIVFEKCGGKCAYCGTDLAGTKWHVDHAEPVDRLSKWVGGERVITGTKEIVTPEYVRQYGFSGTTQKPQRLKTIGFAKPENHHIDNMLPACASCNINKHSYNVDQFRAAIEKHIESLNSYNVQYKMAKRFGLVNETGNKVQFYFEHI